MAKITNVVALEQIKSICERRINELKGKCVKENDYHSEYRLTSCIEELETVVKNIKLLEEFIKTIEE